MVRCNDPHAVDLVTSISKNCRFKFFVYDRREIQTIANILVLKERSHTYRTQKVRLLFN